MSSHSAKRMPDWSVTFSVDTSVYCRDAIVSTAHLFTESCHMRISEEHGKVVVSVSPKAPDVDVQHVVRDFHNELIDQQLRIRLRRETGEIQKLIIAEAFAPLERPMEDQ